MSALTPDQILDRAADLIETQGWSTREYWNDIADGIPAEQCPLCALGAIKVAVGRHPDDPFDGLCYSAIKPLAQHIGGEVWNLGSADRVIGSRWNDLQQEAGPVIAGLRACAADLRAKAGA